MSEEIKFSEKTFVLRPLTRREVKRLRTENLSLEDPANTAKADEIMERVLKIILGERSDEFEDLPYKDTITAYRRIMALTYGTEIEEKN